MPKLENPESVLREIINPEVPPGNIQIIIEPNDVCLGKELSMKWNFKGREEALPSLKFEIGKNQRIVYNLNLNDKLRLYEIMDSQRV